MARGAMTSLINIPNIPLLQNQTISITTRYVVLRPLPSIQTTCYGNLQI